MKKKKAFILVFLLLLISVATYYFVTAEKKISQENFTQQGQTELGAGKISMKVWDNEAEDGDTIQVFFNGKMIADTLAILNTPIEYKLGNLTKGEYWIGVKAINEGSSAPASSSVSLSNGLTEKEFVMDAWVDSAASWKVIIK